MVPLTSLLNIMAQTLFAFQLNWKGENVAFGTCALERRVVLEAIITRGWMVVVERAVRAMIVGNEASLRFLLSIEAKACHGSPGSHLGRGRSPSNGDLCNQVSTAS